MLLTDRPHLLARGISSRACTVALLLLALLTAISLASGCGKGKGKSGAADSTAAAAGSDSASVAKSGDDEGDKTDDAKQTRERAVSVTASPVVRADLVVPVVAEGTIRARRQSEIRFEITGRVTRVPVEEGQRVRAGQVLTTLDDREYQVALEEAKSNFLRAMGQIAVEEDHVDTNAQGDPQLDSALAELDKLQHEGKITLEERRDREMALGVQAVKEGGFRRELMEVRSGLATARAAQARAELDLERTVLRAPFDGVVTDLVLHTGQRVQVGEKLCSVVDDVDLEAEVGVLESDLKVLEIGRDALLAIPALDATVPSKVSVISPNIDPASRTCRVLLRLHSQNGKIKPGMFARASIAGGVYPDRLLVPREAILTRDGRPLLFKVEDGRSKWVYVELGLRNDAAVEITRVLQGGPLDPGTLVVVDNHLTLTHDAAIKVTKTVPLNDPWTQSLAANP